MLNDINKIAFICGTNNPVVLKNTNNEVNFAGSSDAILNAAISVAGDEIVQLQENIKSMIPMSSGQVHKDFLEAGIHAWGI